MFNWFCSVLQITSVNIISVYIWTKLCAERLVGLYLRNTIFTIEIHILTRKERNKTKEHRKINHPVKPPSNQHFHSTTKVCHVLQYAEHWGRQQFSLRRGLWWLGSSSSCHRANSAASNKRQWSIRFKSMDFGDDCVQIQTMSLTSGVTLGKLLNLSVPQMLSCELVLTKVHTSKGGWGIRRANINEALEQCLEPSNCHITGCFYCYY